MNNIESNKGEIVMYQSNETIRLEVREPLLTVTLIMFSKKANVIKKAMCIFCTFQILTSQMARWCVGAFARHLVFQFCINS